MSNEARPGTEEAMRCPKCRELDFHGRERADYDAADGEARVAIRQFCHRCGHRETLMDEPRELFDSALGLK